jgi:hypothetical protein
MVVDVVLDIDDMAICDRKAVDGALIEMARDKLTRES